MCDTIIEERGTTCRYWSKIMSSRRSKRIFKHLKSLPLTREKLVIYGKTHTPNRYTSAYGDVNNDGDQLSYRYSGQIKISNPWTEELLELKERVEYILDLDSDEKFNFALVQLYPDGTSNIGYHSDDERDIVPNSIIAGVSFGSERTFQLKNKVSGDRVDVQLVHGSMITMEGKCQKQYKHCVPVRKRVTEPRISVTFRRMAI